MEYDEIFSQAKTARGGCDDIRSVEVRVSGLPEVTSALCEQLGKEVDAGRLEAEVIRAGSFGFYDLEPIVSVSKQGRATVLYAQVAPEAARELVESYLAEDGRMAGRALCSMGKGQIAGVMSASDLPFFNTQRRVALRNCGLVDPEAIDHYIAACHGYSRLSKLVAKDRAEVAGALKSFEGCCRALGTLQALAEESDGAEKVVVCNGADASPGGMTARLLLEGDPHAVLDGMLIAACVAGAGRCVVVADSGWTVGIERMRKAIEEAKERGLAGDHILGAGFSCDIEIRQADPSLVLGEDTALLRFLEGRQPLPVMQPADSGPLSLSGKPCFVESIETFARISGFPWETGGERCETRVVTLTGDVSHGYTVEIPIETTIRTLVEVIGGGVAAGGSLKAVQLGPTGRLLGPESLDLAIAVAGETGRGTGSATLEVFDGKHCAVEIAEASIAYLQTQSCGKCVFCREGTLQMSDILRSIIAGEGATRDPDLLGKIGEAMRTGCVCAVGAAAADPVLSGITLFRKEYEEHIREKRCRKG